MFKPCRSTRRTALFVLTLVAAFASTAIAKEKAKATAKGGDFDFNKTSIFMREMETRPDFPVALVLANDYVYSRLAIGEAIDNGRQNAVILSVKLAQQKNGGFVGGKSDTSASLLFTNIALETLGYLNASNAIDAAGVKKFAASLKNPDGGFGFSAESKGSSLASTYFALRILKTVGGLDLIDKAKTAAYLKGFEKKSGGFGAVNGPGVASARNTYMAAYALDTLGLLDDAARKNAVKFLETTPYLDAKSKTRPELDDQLYAVLALKVLKASDKIDKKLALAFMKRIYIKVNGGFGPLEGYGSTPDSTTTALRILTEIGQLKKAGPMLAQK